MQQMLLVTIVSLSQQVKIIRWGVGQVMSN